MGKAKFGIQSLDLASSVLRGWDLRKWKRPLALCSRVEMFVLAGASDAQVKELIARWHNHNGDVGDFDDSEITAVEVSDTVLAMVR